VETASFDIQKIKNLDIAGVEYQRGEQMDFWNVREYVLWRDGHKCQHCTGKSRDKVLNVHHIESRKTGGNAPNNLITLCETCHKAYHAGNITLRVKRTASFRDAAFMGIMRWAFYEELKTRYPNIGLTYGYITKLTRIAAELEKAHRIDARCISGNAAAEPACEWYARKAVRRHNRQTHKASIQKGGQRKLNQAPKYVRGFQLFDKVLFGVEECFVFGRRASGSFDVRKLDGTRLSAGVSYKKLTLLERGGTILTERRTS
jgi:N6-L-threonylcarbamoyladenine synthase